MNKTTKNSFLKAACLMLTVIMLTAYVLPETLAKYASTGTVSAEGMALTVAKWDVLVYDTTLGTGDTITVTNTEWTIDSPYKAGLTNAAPGTWGYVEIQITNNSDVDVIYTIKFDIGINFDKNSEYLTGLKVFLDEDSDTIINFNDDYPDMDVSKGIYFTTEEFYLTAGDSKTYNLVADTNVCKGPHSIEGKITGTITVTANQAEETY